MCRALFKALIQNPFLLLMISKIGLILSLCATYSVVGSSMFRSQENSRLWKFTRIWHLEKCNYIIIIVFFFTSSFFVRRELLKGPLYYASTITLASLFFWRTSPVAISAICNLCAGDGIFFSPLRESSAFHPLSNIVLATRPSGLRQVRLSICSIQA